VLIGRSEERAKDRRNFLDNRPQAGAFSLQSCVQEIVVIGQAAQHTIHLRQPAFTEPFGIWVSLIEPVPEQTLPLRRVSPKSAAVLQSRLILIQKSSHRLRNALPYSRKIPMCLAHSACIRSRGSFRFSFGTRRSAGEGTTTVRLPYVRRAARGSQLSGHSLRTDAGSRFTCHPRCCSNSLPIRAS
jgi:hypothetical protein